MNEKKPLFTWGIDNTALEDSGSSSRDTFSVAAATAFPQGKAKEEREIVFCRDCKHLMITETKARTFFTCGNCDGGMIALVQLKGTDFCSYGERRK